LSVGDNSAESMHVPSSSDAARLRAAIARDQATHWCGLVWEPTCSKKDLDQRMSRWIWWAGTAWALGARPAENDKSLALDGR
jgi:hypothetical protein